MDRKTILPLVAAALVLVMMPAAPSVEAQEAGLKGYVCYDNASADGESFAPEGYSSCASRGLPDAQVTLRQVGPLSGVPAFEKTTTTDKSGSYAFSSLDEGDYTITVVRGGFEDYEATVAVKGGAYHDAVLTPLQLEVQIQVFSPSGEPASDAYVRLTGSQGGVRHEAKSPDGAPMSLAVPAGYYDVLVQASGLASEQLSRVLFDASGSVEYTLKDAPPGGKIIGSVIHPDGTPVAGASVEAWSYPRYEERCYEDEYGGYCTAEAHPYQETRAVATTDAEGRFEVSLPAGNVNLHYSKEGYWDDWNYVELAVGETKDVKQTMRMIPEKSADISGTVLGRDGKVLKHISISIENVEHGMHACSQYGDAGDAPKPMPVEPGGAPASEPASDEARSSIAYPYYGGCDIKVNDDGSFSGKVAPGYSILRVYHDHWRSCSETRNADGSSTRNCGPEYHGFTQTLVIKEGKNPLEVRLRERPAANAVLSGYAIDGATNEAIPGVQISFSNMDQTGWGNAQTDADGSYKIRLRSGFHEVYVYAEGYFHWQGQVMVPEGSSAFDVVLTEGQSRWGGCCIAYAESDASAPRAMAGSEGTAASPAAGASTRTATSAPVSGGEGDQYEDLGGGLGPYDPNARREFTSEPVSSEDTPGLAAALVLLGVIAVALRRR